MKEEGKEKEKGKEEVEGTDGWREGGREDWLDGV